MTCPQCADLSDRLTVVAQALDRMAYLVALLDQRKLIPADLADKAENARRYLIQANAELVKERR